MHIFLYDGVRKSNAGRHWCSGTGVDLATSLFFHETRRFYQTHEKPKTVRRMRSINPQLATRNSIESPPGRCTTWNTPVARSPCRDERHPCARRQNWDGRDRVRQRMERGCGYLAYTIGSRSFNYQNMRIRLTDKATQNREAGLSVTEA